MNRVIPETSKRRWSMKPEGNGLVDIRKDEREKTIKEVFEWLKAYSKGCFEPSGHKHNEQVMKHFKELFLSPDPVEELAKELKKLDVSDGCSHEIAAYILDNYELKKK